MPKAESQAAKMKMDPVKAAVFALLFVLDISEPVEVVNTGPVSATASQGMKISEV